MNERQAVTAATYAFAALLLIMAWNDPRLWANDLFKVILQAFAVSAIGQTILGFHFTANKNDETKSQNTAAAFQAIQSVAEQSKPQTMRDGPTGNPGDPLSVTEEKPDV